MKKMNLIAVLLILMAAAVNAQTKVETLKEFLDGIVKFENAVVQEATAILNVKKLAEEQADLVMDLTKETVKEVLANAKEYHFCVITVGVHTIVRITDLENCIQSGSWGACMPMGEGFIQKNGMINKNDYINNIIGTPNGQERKVYFFMKK